MSDSWKLLCKESKASCRLISSITTKDEGAVLHGFPLIRMRKIRILLQIKRKFRRNHRLAKGNTRDQLQLQVDLALAERLSLTLVAARL